MNGATLKQASPEIRRRNRILLLVLLALTLAVAASGVLYLREYGFSNQETESKYH